MEWTGMEEKGVDVDEDVNEKRKRSSGGGQAVCKYSKSVTLRREREQIQKGIR